MKFINQFKILIVLILSFFNNKVISDDLSCFQNLLLTLFNSPISQTPGLCQGSYTREADNPDYYYKLSCTDSQNTLSQLVITSKQPSTVGLLYSNLNCFSTLLSDAVFTNLKFTINSLGGSSSEKKVASRLYIYNCTFDEGFVTAGGSLPQDTTLIDLTINNDSNFLHLDFNEIKYTQVFKLFVSNDLETYPKYSNTIDANQASVINFFTLSIETTEIPFFNYIKATNLYLSLKNSATISSFGNFDSLQYVDTLYIYFDQDMNYPFSLPYTNVKSLTLGGNGELSRPIGKLLKPTAAVNLPPNLEYLYILDSPLFNINGKLPFVSLPSTLTFISIGALGLTSFLDNIPLNIKTLIISNNNFATNGPVSLPDFSQYTHLESLYLTGCNYTSTIPDSYSIYQVYLNDNQLSGQWPQWAVCYKDDYEENFLGNKDLTQGSCLKGSIQPNVIQYNEVSGSLTLTGKNLGFNPHVEQPDLSFMTIVKHSSFSAIWDKTNYGTLPDTLDISFGYQVLTVATKILTPSIQNITKSGNKYTFRGKNFSYIKSDIIIKSSNTQAIVSYIDFYTIELEFSQSLPLGQDIAATIQNQNSNTIVKFTLNTIDNKTTTILPCDLDCNYELGYGICSSTLGRCSCTTPYYDGTQCKDISQFLSSASSTTVEGGIVELRGWFGSLHDQLSIKIGSKDCSVLNHYINSTFANCTIGSGSGTQSITISQNGRTYIAKDMFHFNELSYKCPKDCSLNGIQNGYCNKTTGQCRCYSGYGGYDCNSKTTTESSTSTSSTTSGSSFETPAPTLSPVEIPKSNTTINNTAGSAIINNQQTSYEISILSLVELDINSNIVQIHNLTNQWSLANTESDIYIFKQTILQSCIITYTIEDVKEPREIEFAGLSLSLDIGIKISVTIEKYPFTTSLNTLQLRLESLVGENNSTKELNNECNKKETEVDSSQIDKDQLLNYVVISRNEKTLYGRFLNKALSDSRPTFITTSFISNGTIDNNNNNKQSFIYGLNLPSFTESIKIDPDFSVLVSSSFKKCESSNSEKKRPWVLPVAIVVPCVVVAAGIIVGAIVYNKNRTKILLAKERYKSFSLKSLSKKNMDSLYMNDK